MNSTQSPCAAVTLSGVNTRPGPTLTAWMGFEADEEAAEAVIVMDVDELSSPYCGEARTDVASTPKKRVVEESMECILLFLCGMWLDQPIGFSATVKVARKKRIVKGRRRVFSWVLVFVVKLGKGLNGAVFKALGCLQLLIYGPEIFPGETKILRNNFRRLCPRVARQEVFCRIGSIHAHRYGKRLDVDRGRGLAMSRANVF